MIIIIKIVFLLLVILMGFLANRLEEHLTPTHIENTLLFNLGKIISFPIIGVLLGLLGFLLKINQPIGGLILSIIAFGTLILSLSHLPLFPQIILIGLHSHHHSRKSFLAGLLNIFSSSASLHLIMFIALAHGYYFESGVILLFFALGSLYIPGRKFLNFNKFYNILQIILFIIATAFILFKGLMYSEIFLFSPFESRKTAVVPETLNNIQYLKSDISTLDNRIIISKGYDLNWMIQGEKKGDTIYIPRYRHRSILNSGYQTIVINENKAGFIYFTGRLGRGDYVIKVFDEQIDVFSLPYKKVLDSGYGDDIHGEDYIADQNVPDIKINNFGVSKLSSDKQYIEIEITKNGFNPSVIVLKRGIPAVLNFIGADLTEENKRVIMPSYNEYLEFSSGENPINIPDPLIDFIFYSWKGNYGGYVLIVEDLDGMTIEKAERQIRMLNVNGI